MQRQDRQSDLNQLKIFFLKEPFLEDHAGGVSGRYFA